MTGRYDPITTPDDIVRQIAALEGRLTALNKERSEIAERLRAVVPIDSSVFNLVLARSAD